MANKRKSTPPPTAYDLHAQQVLKDIQFQHRVIEIRDIYAKKYPGLAEEETGFFGVADEATGKHRHYLYLNQLKGTFIENLILALSDEYAVDPEWIVDCVNSPTAIPHLFNKPVQMSRAQVEDDEKGLYIRVQPNTQLRDIISIWDYVEFAKKANYVGYDPKKKRLVRYKPTKNKGPDDPELIYAIFRARSKGLTFPKIFIQYQKGEIELYKDKPTNNFSNSKSLETYYNKHKPTT